MLHKDREQLELSIDSHDAITVDQVARMLGCNPSTVRVLLRTGQLTGHRVGKGREPRGVRVHVSSVFAYRERHAIQPADDRTAGRPATRRRRRVHNPGHDQAMARLTFMGVVLEAELTRHQRRILTRIRRAEGRLSKRD
jgi:excisionase family DNA binding protein